MLFKPKLLNLLVGEDKPKKFFIFYLKKNSVFAYPLLAKIFFFSNIFLSQIVNILFHFGIFFFSFFDLVHSSP